MRDGEIVREEKGNGAVTARSVTAAV
jgi:hypothetical protein